MHFSQWNDTIVAIATAPGVAAIGVIRLSGPTAISITEKIFSKTLNNQQSHTLHFGKIKDQDKIIDEVLVSLFKNPNSYTGEDVVEISCHGSPFIQNQILQLIINTGARLAKPGEFTQRAFLNGKLDLTQAEAVADMIASNSQASQQAAIHTLRGGFKKKLGLLREELIQFAALIELELDFAEEDVEFVDRTKFKALLAKIEQEAQLLLTSFTLGNVIKNGISVAIIGKPNAGKSTLLNALLNDDRAIVSNIAGTTRDTIEANLQINGVLFRLIDTAGIRQQTDNEIEQLGIARSLQEAADADVVLHLVDINDKTIITDVLPTNTKKQILVYNKIDIATVDIKDDNAIFISAKNNEQIEYLKTKLYELAVGTTLNKEDTIVTNARHAAALQQLVTSIHTIQNGLATNLPTDIIALEIKHALNHIAEITGELSNEDLLDYIFSKFCIGK
jgi:tRNA modification GTPase